MIAFVHETRSCSFFGNMNSILFPLQTRCVAVKLLVDTLQFPIRGQILGEQVYAHEAVFLLLGSRVPVSHTPSRAVSAATMFLQRLRRLWFYGQVSLTKMNRLGTQDGVLPTWPKFC